MRKRGAATGMALAAVLGLGGLSSCIVGMKKQASLESENFNVKDDSMPDDGQGHGENVGPSTFKSTGQDLAGRLNYRAALDHATNLPSKGKYGQRNAEIRAARKAGRKPPSALCASGTREIVNVLFGRNKDRAWGDGSRGYGSACMINEHALNTGGLGASSGKGVRYKAVSPSSLGGKMPEGSVVVCNNGGKSCGPPNHGHAEAFMGGRFSSGANYTGYSLCIQGAQQGRYSNVRVYVLEAT